MTSFCKYCPSWRRTSEQYPSAASGGHCVGKGTGREVQPAAQAPAGTTTAPTSDGNPGQSPAQRQQRSAVCCRPRSVTGRRFTERQKYFHLSGWDSQGNQWIIFSKKFRNCPIIVYLANRVSTTWCFPAPLVRSMSPNAASKLLGMEYMWRSNRSGRNILWGILCESVPFCKSKLPIFLPQSIENTHFM